MKINTQWVGLGLASVLLLAACTPEPAVEEGPPPDPVVVYAAYDDKTYLPTLFTEFTAETGQIVLVRNGKIPGIVDDVIGDRVSPPADILLTPSVHGVWRVAEEGELRPHYSTVVDSNAPAWLRDPDNFWVALSYRNAVVVYDTNQFAATDLSGYADLSAPEFRRKLCLSTSSLTINRTVIAMLIRKLGARETELAVRGWVANLAQPVFSSEENLMSALTGGDCAVGIVASDAAVLDENSALKIHLPAETYVDAEAVGITRHARNPGGAAVLIDWLLQDEIQKRHATHMSALPVVKDAAGKDGVVHSAYLNEEATKLAERARYR
ncbi:MAG: extracellular solute-binding protein [Woeseiaceae bacterium]